MIRQFKLLAAASIIAAALLASFVNAGAGILSIFVAAFFTLYFVGKRQKLWERQVVDAAISTFCSFLDLRYSAVRAADDYLAAYERSGRGSSNRRKLTHYFTGSHRESKFAFLEAELHIAWER